MLDGNNQAILDHLILNGFTKKYKIILLVKYPQSYQKHIDNLTTKVGMNLKESRRKVIIRKNPILTILHLMTSKYIFHTHGMSYCSFRPSPGQVIFNLWHGSPLKAMGTQLHIKQIPWKDTYFLSNSEYFNSINKKNFGYSDNQLFVCGNSRNDFLFSNNNQLGLIMNRENKKIIIYMPTFKKSSIIKRTESEYDIPIINEANIFEVDELLSKNNCVLLIKLHPYQDNITFLNRKFSNIILLNNDFLIEKDINLYSLLSECDLLLTDYSSVYFDYLITQKPIGFLIDDFVDYEEKRGFTVENPLAIMPGKKIKTFDEMKSFINEYVAGIDDYIIDREHINQLVNVFQDGNNCHKILSYIGISNNN